MIIKAREWLGLTADEKMDLLVHYSYHNEVGRLLEKRNAQKNKSIRKGA